MAQNKDILIGQDGDLQIVNGDFVLGEALEQQIEHLFLADKGAYKDYPIIGVGIKSMLNNRLKGPQEIVREGKLQLQSDGWQQIDLQITNGDKVNVHAVR